MKYKWEVLWISSMALWWLFPIITIFTYNYIGFIYSLAFSSLFSIIFFLIFFVKNKEWKYFQIKKWWSSLFSSAILIGIVFYFLIFYWLQYTDAINESLLWLSQVLFSYLLFWLFFTEKKSTFNEIIGSSLLVIWTIIILFPWKINIHYGDIFIIIANFVAPIWNNFARKAIKIFSTNFLMLIRSILATIFLFIYWYFYADFPEISNLYKVLPYLIFSWIFLFGTSKIFFIEGLKYISLPRLSSFIALYPIFTILYSIILFWNFPRTEQVLGLLPMWIWILIFFNRIKIKNFLITKK
jgi:drug/metabolite transporter (DMT)-like permease